MPSLLEGIETLPAKSDWTVSAAQLEALQQDAGRLRDVTARGAARSIESQIRQVRATFNKLLAGMSPVPVPGSQRVPIRQQWFRPVQAEIDQQLAKLAQARQQKSPEQARNVNQAAKEAGEEVVAIISRALARPGLERYLP